MDRPDDYESSEKRPAPAGGRRFTMKSLSALVDENRVRSGTTPDRTDSTGPRARTPPRPANLDDVEDNDSYNGVVSQTVVESPTELDGPEPNDEPAATVEVEPIDEPSPADEPEPTDESEPTRLETSEPPAAADLQTESEVEDVDENAWSTDVESVENAPAALTGDGVDRNEIGTAVTRSGLADLLEPLPGPKSRSGKEVVSSHSLARRILDEEIAPGGRLSNPDDIPGIVLTLAKELPAAAAVSVVRISEEVQLVGNTIDPNFDPAMLTSVFSAVFRTMQAVGGVFDGGPLGRVNDVVIEGEYMDLVFRPLGVHYYLMVLEDRRLPEANLVETRRRMATLAPGLAAILAHDDGQI